MQVAVIGPNAATARTLVAVVRPFSRRTWCRHSTGCVRHSVRRSDRARARRAQQRAHRDRPKDLLWLPDGSGPGVEVIFFDAEDRELGREQRQAASMMWWGPVQEV